MNEKNTIIGMSNPSSNSTSQSARNFRGVRAVPISKNSPEHLLFRRLRQRLLFAKPRSLIPPQAFQQVRTFGTCEQEKTTEVKVESHEIPQGDSDEDMEAAPSASSSGAASSAAPAPALLDDDEDNDGKYKIEVEVEDESKPLVPSIQIIKSEASLLISTIVLKDMSLSSTLFQILEQEELQIDYENQYRSEKKVSHNIKVNVRPGYDVDQLEKKLWRWAGKPI
ncbi:hypothetical protein NE237_008876 [Protea cynaroides]|uniref:Uncharacterized protein n=1 Tax=Protea cynaroides TaxID=273540 RepID=A0A9Q0KXK0_9MAGN|nr:hypothetical protein NE237_008876 [Protea cynaroides]